jgi:hypothetical protein
MFTTLRIIYRFLTFIILFILIGSLIVYFENIYLIEKNTLFINESELKNTLITKKKNIPIYLSLVVSYFLSYKTPWFKRKKN